MQVLGGASAAVQLSWASTHQQVAKRVVMGAGSRCTGTAIHTTKLFMLIQGVLFYIHSAIGVATCTVGTSPWPPRLPSSPCPLCRYAFVLYLTKEGTAEVLTKLNQAELTDFPGRKVTIVKSDVKNKLFIGNLPKTLSRDQIFEAIKAEVVGEWEPVGRLWKMLSEN